MSSIFDLSNLFTCPICDNLLIRQSSLVYCTSSEDGHWLAAQNDHINIFITKGSKSMDVWLFSEPDHIRYDVYINDESCYSNIVPHFEINDISIKDIAPKL